MQRVGIVGFGFMGRMHFDNYVRLAAEGAQLELVAICDLLIEELKNSSAAGNITTEQEVYDLSPYHLYSNLEEMLAHEELDMIDLCLPTHIHAELSCDLLERGYHVLCEKPIAGSSSEGWRMAKTAQETGKTLMIGQCLRFWPAYEYLKSCVEDNRYGAAKAGYFFRGGGTPAGWFLDANKSGGCITDMHVHDADMIQWLFGKPQKVSTLAQTIIAGSSYDMVSTNYIYEDGKVVNAQADWTLQGDFGFNMTYRVNFEHGNLVFENNVLKVNPYHGPGFIPELSPEMGYYYEIKYFIEALNAGTPVSVCTPESAAQSLELIEAEIRSADLKGELVTLS